MKRAEEILKNKIKEKFGDTELINKYVYEQCIIAGVLEAMEEYAQQERDKFKPLYIAASDLLHLHLCEQEGIGSGQPTAQQWIKAVDKLSEALGLNDKK